ncbi:MAG: 50S ribosomal protein L5, partial [Negativicoccus succinicivorans]|nr:50S ribosomal protein L5 [Negativicoccus succinicivorans]
MSRLKDFYNSQIKNDLREKFNYKNVMEIPKLEKIVINIGVGEAVANSKAL